MLKNELTDTCVQRDKHLCSSRQTQVFETTDASVCQTGEYRGNCRRYFLAVFPLLVLKYRFIGIKVKLYWE